MDQIYTKIFTTGSMLVDRNTMFRNLNQPEFLDQYKSYDRIYFNSLYFETENSKIIFDPGSGSYAARLFSDFQYGKLYDPAEYLIKINLSPADITDVFLTHLHFDHCLAVFSFSEEKAVPSFPKARIHVSRKQMDYIRNLPKEEYDSFLPGFDKLLLDNYKVFQYEEGEKPGFVKDLFFSDGHTPGMMIPFIEMNKETMVFASDLFPAKDNLEMNVVSGYDRNPKLLMDEKMLFTKNSEQLNLKMIFYHDKV